MTAEERRELKNKMRKIRLATQWQKGKRLNKTELAEVMKCATANYNPEPKKNWVESSKPTSIGDILNGKISFGIKS